MKQDGLEKDEQHHQVAAQAFACSTIQSIKAQNISRNSSITDCSVWLALP